MKFLAEKNRIILLDKQDNYCEELTFVIERLEIIIINYNYVSD